MRSFSLFITLALTILTCTTVTAESLTAAAGSEASSVISDSGQKQNIDKKEVDAAVSKESAEKSVGGSSPQLLPSDVRVLIDISGSMKKTDPQNLRKPALDLIVRLLPDKSRAGVWVFGNSTEVLMRHSAVNEAWRKEAAPKANQISSISMFTNIGKALDAVSFDKTNLAIDYKTHIILLTDGVVDVSKEAVDNMKERQRVLTEIIPDLKKAGYIVHTIALSADADADLLKKLSVATDGVSSIALSADDLMPTFLKIFDQAVPAERLPLENNGFLVDASVKEFTALIFRKAGVTRTVIRNPDGKEFSATSPQDGINWYHTDKYDLITSDTPKAGQWQIKTDIAPQSRITVVSNLQLAVQPLKNNLHINDGLHISYSFQENGKTITSKDFLDLLEANAIVAKEGTEENTPLTFTTTSSPADGIYHQTINTFTEQGSYAVHVYVDGKTFKREFKHNLSVRDSVLGISKSKTDGEKTVYSYKITADEKIVEVKKAKITATVKNSKTNNIEKTLVLQEPNFWEFSFSPTQETDYVIQIHGEGDLLDGSKFDETLTADKFTYELPVKEVAEIKKEEEVAPEPVVEKPAEDKSNLLLYIGIGVGNLLILLLGFFAYRMMVSGKAKDEFSEIEKTLAEADKPKKSDVAAKPQEKLEIDLSEEDSAHIPMNDDLNLDSLFPLDNLDESDSKSKPR